MIVTPTSDPALAAVRPQPLRLVPSLAAIGLVIALGSLSLGTCSFVLQQIDGVGLPGPAIGIGVPLGAIALWVSAGGCLYAANRQWLGRTRDQQLVRFAICMAIVLPLAPIVVIVGVNVLLALGGSL